jgi:hypothetical protein
MGAVMTGKSNLIEQKRVYDRARYLRAKTLLPARPLDAIEGLSLVDRAYLAGLVDGEGSIYCGAFGPRRKLTCYPAFAIGMTDRAIIEWVAERLGVAVSYVCKRKKNPNWKDQYFVRLTGRRAQLLCSVLLPFLKVKRRQAELVLLFPCEARFAPGLKIEGSEINITRFGLRDQINALNHRPRNQAARRASEAA